MAELRWRHELAEILSPGNSGNIDVAPTNGSNVVIAAGAQVFVSTNALATTGVAFINITRNLPHATWNARSSIRSTPP